MSYKTDRPKMGEKESAAFLKQAETKDKRRNSESKFVVPLFLNSKSGTGFRDSGAMRTVVESSFVNNEDYTGNTIRVSGIFGDEIEVKTAKVRIKSPKFQSDNEIVQRSQFQSGNYPTQSIA